MGLMGTLVLIVVGIVIGLYLAEGDDGIGHTVVGATTGAAKAVTGMLISGLSDDSCNEKTNSSCAEDNSLIVVELP